MSFPVSLIGDAYLGGIKWNGGALASDGCIYAAPALALQILKIDPIHCTTTLVGSPLSDFGGKYSGAMATNDGHVYFVPLQATHVLKFNVETQAIQRVGEKYGGTISKWIGGAMGNDGCFYCAPFQARWILKVDPSNDSTSLVGDDLGGGLTLIKYSGVVASQDKATLRFIPFDAKTILTYDVSTEQCTYIPVDQLDCGNQSTKWDEGALGPDGCIYAMPFNANKILKYNPSRRVNGPTLDNYDSSSPENPTLVGDDMGSQTLKWSGAVLGRDGCIYGIPNNASKVLRYIPQTNTTTLVGNDFPGKTKWLGGVCDNNGNIVAIPQNHPRVLRIIPSLFSHNPQSMTSYQPSGMDDSPNNRADRLGYELYAKALVDHILSVERTGESISVGLFSPWGSGKSFFWNLTRKEFERRDQQEQKEYQDSATEQERGTEAGDGWSFMSFLGDVGVGVQQHQGSFWYWPVLILFCIIVIPLMIIWALFYYLQNLISILDIKLTNSPWGNKYKSCKGMILLWQKNIASFCSLAFLGIPLLWDQIWKVVAFVSRSFFCCYKRGMWKIRRHKDTIYIYVEFDAWTYRGTENIWASILEMLWRAVEEELGSEKVKWHRAGIALAGSKLSDPLDIRLKKEEMARKKLQIGLNVSITLFAWSLVGLLAALAVFLVNYFQADEINENCQNQGKTIFACMINPIFVTTVSVSTIVSVVNLVFRVQNNKAILQPGSKRITDKVNYYNRKDFKKEIGFMGVVQDEVVYLFEFLKSQNARIRLFVDDLDRCNQDVAMDVLWAISLLFGPNDGPCPITSFLAIDTKVLVDYIENEFDGKANGFGYLEKIINLPFAIPPISNEKKIDFCERVVDTHELNVSQVYRKALNFKYKYLRETQDIVCHLNDRTLQIGDKKALLGDLILMGEKMNLSGEERLAFIDFDLLLLSNVIETPSRQEELLVILRGNIDILENEIWSFHRPSDVYNNLYDLLNKNVWLGEMLGVTLSAPREGLLVMSMRKEDDLIQELYDNCCVSGKSENMRKAFPTPINLGQLKGIERSRSITQYVKNLTEHLDTMLKNLNVNFVLELYRKQIHLPVTPPNDMDKKHELSLLALNLDLEAPSNEFSDNSEEWKQFLFKVQLVLKTQLSQTCVEDSGTHDDSNGASGDLDNSNHDGSKASDNISKSGENIDDSSTITVGPDSDNVPTTNTAKTEIDSEERPFYEYRSMVTDDERKFLRVYSCFLDGVPRKIKRILNVYNVTRYIAKKANGGNVESVFLEKLFILTILQELCPYRTSWLMFISQCAQDEDVMRRSLVVEYESIFFHSFLQDLKREKGCNDIKDLSLATIYSRIVCGVLHCIPSAERNLHADSGIMSYIRLLELLVLGDLFPSCLQQYVFNLPRSMMNEINTYQNHCIIGKRTVRKGLDNVEEGEEKDAKNYWVASFQKMATLENRNTCGHNSNDANPYRHDPRFVVFDGVGHTSHKANRKLHS